MRLINYRCKDCGKDVEELYTSSELETLAEELEEKCDCGGTFVKFDFKNNPQIWKFLSARN